MAKYKYRPDEIDAVQITDAWFDFDINHSDLDLPKSCSVVRCIREAKNRHVIIKTNRGKLWGRVGHWLIREKDGSTYMCDEDVFATMYVPVK